MNTFEYVCAKGGKIVPRSLPFLLLYILNNVSSRDILSEVKAWADEPDPTST